MSGQETSSSDTVGPVEVMYSEMNMTDQGFAIETCTTMVRNQEKVEQVTYYKDVAKSIKDEFDKQKGGTWNVVVGRSFGSFVTHETKTIVYFYLGNVGFLIWRHG
jgi:dynein light chain LC8-type